MYTLVDKQEKIGYNGVDLMAISSESGKSVHTLRSWNKKGSWHENVRYILFEVELIKSNRGGLNAGNEKYFIK